MIKLKDILNETTKKSRIKEDNFLNRFFGNKSSGISKFGNWDYVTIDESPNRDSVYISDMVATSNFISRLNSTPSLKELLKKSGKIKSIYATAEGFPGDHVTEYTIKFPQKSISSMFRTKGSSSKEINAEEQNKEFDSLLIMLNGELVKEWNSKLWLDKFDDIKKYSQKFEPEYPDKGLWNSPINEDSSWSISDKKKFGSELGSKLESALQPTVSEWKGIIKESVMELVGKNLSEVDVELKYETTAQSPIKEIQSFEFEWGIQKGISGFIRIFCTLENGKNLSGLIPVSFDNEPRTKKEKVNL